jgi:hypothetical protein
MGRLAFADNGYVVHRPNPEQDVDYDTRGDFGEEGFAGRQPVIVDNRDIYVGSPDWYHDDVAKHHGIDPDYWHLPQGYFGSKSPQWGGGNLKWYRTPAEHPEIAQALNQAGYKIPNMDPEAQPDYETDDDLWADDPPEYHHPLDEEDEWR